MLVSNQVSGIIFPPGTPSPGGKLPNLPVISPAPKTYSLGGLSIPYRKISSQIDALSIDAGGFNWKSLLLGIAIGAGAFWAIQKFLIK